MIRNLLTTIASGAILSTGLLTTLNAAEFTHTAAIPANADAHSIRFEKARLVMLPVQTPQTANSSYCEEAAARDASGSAFCPSLHQTARQAAYVVTFSYNAPSAAWMEGPQARSTFQVVYRPDELSPAMQKALSEHRRNREIAEYFALKTAQGTAARSVVDASRSSFCDGSFVEGAWTHSNSKCADHIVSKTVAARADFMTVQVEPATAELSASIPSRQ